MSENILISKPVSSESSTIQKSFLINTYSHLMLAVGVFALSLYVFVTNSVILKALFALYTIPFAPFVIMALIIGISYCATFLANSQSKPLQYLGLVLYPVAEAVLFVPLILIFLGKGAVGTLTMAAGITIALFVCLSIVVFVTKPDLGFLSKFLMFGSLAAFVMIIASFIFGFTLGAWFSVAMITLACGYILYETSSIMDVNTSTSYVGAALSLFASLAMLFFYILRLFASRD